MTIELAFHSVFKQYKNYFHYKLNVLINFPLDGATVC